MRTLGDFVAMVKFFHAIHREDILSMLHLMRGPQTLRNKICDIRKSMRKIEERETGISKFCRFVEEEKCLVSPRPCMTLIYSCTSVPKYTVSSLSVPYVTVALSRISDYLVQDDEDSCVLQHFQFDLLESLQAASETRFCYYFSGRTLILQINLSFQINFSHFNITFVTFNVFFYQMSRVIRQIRS